MSDHTWCRLAWLDKMLRSSRIVRWARCKNGWETWWRLKQHRAWAAQRKKKLWMTTRAVIFLAVSRSWAVRVSALLQGSAVLLGWALWNCWPFWLCVLLQSFSNKNINRLSANQPVVLFSHTKLAPATNQQYYSLITNQHQPSATTKRTQRMIFDREHLTFWTILTEPFFNNRICSVATSKLNYCKNRRSGIFIHMCIEISGNVKFWRNKHV